MTNATRRAILAGVPAAAIAATIPAGAAPADRRAWEHALAIHQRAKQAEEAFYPVWQGLHAKCRADCENVPHIVLRPDPYTGRNRPVSTADWFYVARARDAVKKLDAGETYLDPSSPSVQAHYQLQRDVAAAADDYDSDIQAIRDGYGMDEADDHFEALGEATNNAEAAVMATPAPDLAALRWKLDRLLELEHTDDEDGGSFPAWAGHYVAQTLADIARLLPEGR